MINKIPTSYSNILSSDYWDIKFNQHLKIEEEHSLAVLNLDSLVFEGDPRNYRLRLNQAVDAIKRNIANVIKSPTEQTSLKNLLTYTHDKLVEVDKQCRTNA